MENKNVGYIILGISLLLIIIIFLFQSALTEIVSQSCDMEHAIICPMESTINQQTYLALSIVGLLIIIGLVLIFTKQKEKIIIKKVVQRKKKLKLDNLDRDEKKVINLLQKENGAIFQKTLMEKMDIGKVKTTRLLDKLEAKQLIERKRRGMNNIVVLRN
ncbi:hypothetical protein HN865_05165 [Candidatus Woesearchaeota archaeon]|jgi:uncharacterized membrane protein|nr:hypothetical protein [Candidatus Woesearchaeota archaeon]